MNDTALILVCICTCFAILAFVFSFKTSIIALKIYNQLRNKHIIK